MTRDEYLREHGNWVTSKGTFKVTDASGREINPGDEIESRGEVAVFEYASRFQSDELGKSGKVCVQWKDRDYGGEYYDRIFGLTVEMV